MVYVAALKRGEIAAVHAVRFVVYAKAVFSIPVSSAIVKSLFSQGACSTHVHRVYHAYPRRTATAYGRYAHLKSKRRASLLDDTVKAILLTQAFADVLGDPAVPFTLSSFVLSSDAYAAWVEW